jgi:hypothetical protein
MDDRTATSAPSATSTTSADRTASATGASRPAVKNLYGLATISSLFLTRHQIDFPSKPSTIHHLPILQPATMYNPIQTKAAIATAKQHSSAWLASRGATCGARTRLGSLNPISVSCNQRITTFILPFLLHLIEHYFVFISFYKTNLRFSVLILQNWVGVNLRQPKPIRVLQQATISRMCLEMAAIIPSHSME